MQERISEHRGYIQHKDMNQPTGRHFNSRGHKLSDMCAISRFKNFVFKELLLLVPTKVNKNV